MSLSLLTENIGEHISKLQFLSTFFYDRKLTDNKNKLITSLAIVMHYNKGLGQRVEDLIGCSQLDDLM